MRRRSFLLGTSAAAVGLGCGQVFDVDPLPGVVEIAFEDRMPAFFAFWEQSRGLPPDTRRARFEAEILGPDRALYTPPVLPARHLDDRLDGWLATLDANVPAMRETHTRFVSEREAAESRFTAALPDFDWRGRVVLYPSVSAFVGAARLLEGHPAVLLGLDTAASESRDLVLSLHHELFHMYQVPGGENLAEALWVEGLATYASLALTPGRSDADALPTSYRGASTVSLEAVMPPLVGELGPALRSELRQASTGAAYTRFFSERVADEAIPSRSGFWFGLTLVRRIARGRSLRELAALEPPSLVDEVDRELAALVRGG
ncbi:MAG: hypothetical protein AB8I08_17190 [Sandaracinaceae bacterium]